MKVEPVHGRRAPSCMACGTPRPAAALRALVFAAALTGCVNLSTATAVPPPAANRNTTVQAALAYHQSIRTMSANELARERAAQSAAALSPLGQIKQAMLLSHPQGGGNPARALALLEAVGASDKPEALALQPLARLLAEQLQERQRLEQERQRLENTAERLTQQLERTGQQLKDSQKQGEQLQEKLDALTEIERTLPARPATPTAPLPIPAERRNGR